MSTIDLDIGFHLAIDADLESALCARFDQAADWIVKRFELERLVVSISVVDDPTIHRVNREHLDHDWPTDVISFPFESGKSVNGEIIASWDTAGRLSQVAGWSPSDELVLYVVHGMLHLAGLDDIDPTEKRRMRELESQFLHDTAVPGAADYLNRFDDVSY